jgi:hypothetical protein
MIEFAHEAESEEAQTSPDEEVNRIDWSTAMDEEQFDSLMQCLPFGTEDAMRADAALRRRSTLSLALWGRTSADLQRQLLAVHPEIPSGFNLDDLRDLERDAQAISSCLSEPRFAWLSHLAFCSWVISAGTQNFTAWEARCEIVRRAIKYLETH